MVEIKSRMPGKVVEIKVKVGDAVTKGQEVIVLEAMKMKTPLPTPEAGTVKEIKVAADGRVSAGDILIVIE